MSIWDWLPAPPWEGPPLPRFLGVTWPFILPTFSKPEATYQNEETWQWVDYHGNQRSITVHRNATRR